MGSHDDPCGAAVLLTGGEAGYSSAQALNVDGGNALT
jgi:hypothetical protein